eukprot:6184596-Pleurochrysis_carterae.AAC.2
MFCACACACARVRARVSVCKHVGVPSACECACARARARTYARARLSVCAASMPSAGADAAARVYEMMACGRLWLESACVRLCVRLFVQPGRAHLVE